MNWTGGQRARASKKTDGPLHRQRQYFARVRAAETSNAYAAASSSPNRYQDDGPAQKRRKLPAPEFDILRGHPPKPTFYHPNLELDLQLKSHGPSNERIKATKRKLLQMGDWVGAKTTEEDKEREQDLEKKDRNLMDSVTRRQTPVPKAIHASGSHANPGQRAPSPTCPPSSPRTRAPTLITEASRNYGIIGLTKLSQGGYLRIGKATRPPPLQPRGHPSSSIASHPARNMDDTSQDSMLLDYEEHRAEKPNRLASRPEDFVEKDDGGHGQGPRGDPWRSEFEQDGSNELVPRFSPGTHTQITTSSRVSAESDVFAPRNTSSPPIRHVPFIRRRNINYTDNPMSPASPTKASKVTAAATTTNSLRLFPNEDKDDDSDDGLEPLRRDGYNSLSDLVCVDRTEVFGLTEDDETTWRIFIQNSPDGDGEGEEYNDDDDRRERTAGNDQPLSESTCVTDHRGLTSVPLPSTPPPAPALCGLAPVPSSPPIIRQPTPLTSEVIVTSDQQMTGRVNPATGANEAWFNFTSAPSGVLQSTSSPSAHEVPSPKPVAFTDVENRAWRAFVFASSQASDAEESLLREEAGLDKSAENGNAVSEVSAASIAAIAGSVIRAQTNSDVESRIGGIPSEVDCSNKGSGREECSRDLASVVAVVGDVDEGPGRVKASLSGDDRRKKTWKPPRKFTGDCRVADVEEDTVEDIEEW